MLSNTILASKNGSKSSRCITWRKTSRVIGTVDNKIVDMDIDEALAIERKFDEETYEIAEILSK